MKLDKYPKPILPVLPVLDFQSISFNKEVGLNCVRDARFLIAVSSGTDAIGLALRHIGIKKGDKVLVPAYHCKSMIDPILVLSGVPIYYNLNSDLSVDIKDLETKIDGDCKAVLVPHYFGFPQQSIETCRNICDRFGIPLIEDCAHAFFSAINGKPLGSFGDYCITSTRKFFPGFEGGCLSSTFVNVDEIDIQHPSLSYNIKAIIDIFEESIDAGKLKYLSSILTPLLFIKSFVWKKIKSKQLLKEEIIHNSSQEIVDVSSCESGKGIATPTKLLYHYSNNKRLIEKRTKYYRMLSSAFTHQSGIRPLYPNLPDEVVPYMFPAIIDMPENVFPKLKMQGVPIFRWDNMYESNCAISTKYSIQLLQLPCHQELNEKDIKWIIDVILSTLKKYHNTTSL